MSAEVTSTEQQLGAEAAEPTGRDLPRLYQELTDKYNTLLSRHEELVRQMGDEIAPFPDAGIDGFLSHFIISLEVLQGALAGASFMFRMPPAVQTVARSAPFVYQGSDANHAVAVPLPEGCTLPETVSESDFLNRPANFFRVGQQVVWMQILNLDARMETDELGPVRIILGETLKREHPDIFQPSLGVAESLGREGFPARLFFNPYAVIETAAGSFRAIHGTLAYGRITAFPPVGTPVSICECIPMESIDDVRRTRSLRAVDESIEPFARLTALSHPIDVAMQISGDEAFNYVERRIALGSAGRP